MILRGKGRHGTQPSSVSELNRACASPATKTSWSSCWERVRALKCETAALKMPPKILRLVGSFVRVPFVDELVGRRACI